MDYRQFIPGKTDRMIIMGQSGSGKSTLGRLIYTSVPKVLIIDPKREVFVDRAVYIEQVKDLKTALRKDVVIWQWTPETLGDFDVINGALWDVFKSGRGRLLHISELSLLCRGPMSYPSGLQAIYQQGRSLQISVCAETQRPSGVPVFTMSECQKYAKFRLLMRRDQERAADWMGNVVIEPKDYPDHSVHESEHSFWFLDVRKPPAKQYVLQLGAGDG
jgi:ABC-type dipeptide/oligopeptide/nickel transport system ATPase component